MVYGINFEIIIYIFHNALYLDLMTKPFFFLFNLNEKYFFSVKDFDPFMDYVYI